MTHTFFRCCTSTYCKNRPLPRASPSKVVPVSGRYMASLTPVMVVFFSWVSPRRTPVPALTQGVTPLNTSGLASTRS